MDEQQLRESIRAKVIELAQELGNDARALKDDQVIPRTGHLDSSAIMGLIAWYEMTLGLDIPQEELTLDNFGSVDLMVKYAKEHGA